MSPLDRSEKFQIRLTQAERKMLEQIADIEGLSASDVVRQLVRQHHTVLANDLTLKNVTAPQRMVEKSTASLRAVQKHIDLAEKARGPARHIDKIVGPVTKLTKQLKSQIPKPTKR